MAETQKTAETVRINMLEERVADLRKRVDTFDDIKEVLIELKLLTTQQIEANEQRDTMLQEHGIALARAMDSLKEINKKQDTHEEELTHLNKKMSDAEKRGNIYLGDVGRNVLMLVIGAVVTALLSKIAI